MGIDIRVQGDPWRRLVTLKSIARRNICSVRVGDESFDIIISAVYVDKNDVEWLQGVNVSDIVDNVSSPDLSNILFKTTNISYLEFKDMAIYHLDLLAHQASSIMQRTDKIVRFAKDGILMLEEAEEFERVLEEGTSGDELTKVISVPEE